MIPEYDKECDCDDCKCDRDERNKQHLCKHCGACCRVLPLLQAAMAKEQIQNLRIKGVKEDQGFFLLEHTCQHLKQHVVWGSGGSAFEYLCDIHETKPMTCKRWTGQKRIRNTHYYIPPGCVYARQ